MFESTVSFLMSEQLGGETFVPALGPTGYDRLNAPNRKPFRTRDGYMCILPYNAAHWTAFFELVGRPDEARSPRVQDPVLRSQSVNDLYAVIAEVAPSRTTDEWLAALRERDIPCARVNGIGDLLHDPHLVATGYFRDADRLSAKFLHLVTQEFEEHSVIVEKYDVVQRQSDVRAGLRFGYASNEIGFGWTNAVFIELLAEMGEPRWPVQPGRPRSRAAARQPSSR